MGTTAERTFAEDFDQRRFEPASRLFAFGELGRRVADCLLAMGLPGIECAWIDAQAEREERRPGSTPLRRTPAEADARFIEGADLVFLVGDAALAAGPAAQAARMASRAASLTLAALTLPPPEAHCQAAQAGLLAMLGPADAVIALPLCGPLSARAMLVSAVRGIADLVLAPGLFCFDFPDLFVVMKGQGLVAMGTGVASGPDRAYEATLAALESETLRCMDLSGATRILVSVTAGLGLAVAEYGRAWEALEGVGPADAIRAGGVTLDTRMKDEAFRVTVYAAGVQPKEGFLRIACG